MGPIQDGWGLVGATTLERDWETRYMVPSGHSSGDQSLGGDPGSAPRQRFRPHLRTPGLRIERRSPRCKKQGGILPLDEPGIVIRNQGSTLV
jgi:hypothetical protein